MVWIWLVVAVYSLIGARFTGYKHGLMTDTEIGYLWSAASVGPLAYIIWFLMWPFCMSFHSGKCKSIKQREKENKLAALDREFEEELRETRQRRMTETAEEWVKSNG